MLYAAHSEFAWTKDELVFAADTVGGELPRVSVKFCAMAAVGEAIVWTAEVVVTLPYAVTSNFEKLPS